MCLPGCRHSWNTFDTRGVCPACVHVWESTQCLACGQMSPHEAWYHDEEPSHADWAEQTETVCVPITE